MSKRKNFGKLTDVLEIPDLIGIQLDSYAEFLQMDVASEKRQNKGLEEVFKEVFPIESFDQSCSLDFVNYEIGPPKHTMVECIRTGKSLAAPLYATLRLENVKKNEVKEEAVFLGEMPLMTDRGTFIINGAERVIISQLHRTPGICFERVRHTSGRSLFSCRIIPDRGSWLEIQYDINDLIYIYLDRRRRRRKFLISTFLRAIGYESNRELLDIVYGLQTLKISKLLKFDPEKLAAHIVVETIKDEKGAPISDDKDNEVGRALEPLTEDMLLILKGEGVTEVDVVDTSDLGHYFIYCLQHDPCDSRDEALKEIYRRMRPGDPPSASNAKLLLKRLFFDKKRYDLGLVGRHKINQKLDVNVALDERTLQDADLIESTKYLMRLRSGDGHVDDIDHLGSRRVRTVGELIQNQIRVGLSRTERLIRERMTLIDMEEETVTAQKLVNPKALVGVIRDFFGRSQLSQFMDQTNPLAELTNKRRLSALGPGGLSRERAGFEVRDVHSSHYGRVCPIETPEGPNIGLISSLALYGRINKYGFIETPYRRVKKSKLDTKVDYMTADVEEGFVIAQANAPVEKGKFVNNYVMARTGGDTIEAPSEEVKLMDVSPKQLVSAAAGLIPFLEHDDANRALMGSNMQRQAVPLLKADSPLVGTGLEAVVARDSRAVICARDAGIVAASSAERIIVTKDGKLPDATSDPKKVQEYILHKFMRSNSSTCINQTPVVKSGQRVKKNEVLADGPATQGGELALGRNVLVAFMPWCGYNFEDAIVISEELVKEDVYTSIHISEFDITARDTKLGPEEITRDIPNVSEEALRNLGPEGIVRIGAEVVQGDILVGKITPKSETELDPEERLLRAIFGEKAADVKDSSLVVPSGTNGIVMDVEVERKIDPNKARLTRAEIKRQIKETINTFKAQHSELLEELSEKLSAILLGAKLSFDIVNAEDEEAPPIVPRNRKITKMLCRKLAQHHTRYKLPAGPTRDQIEELMKSFTIRVRDLEMRRDEMISRYEGGDGEDPGVIRQVKVYVASKRKITVGDKMAGRHGNKGIVAKVAPIEDLPHMADGTPVQIILNPLGVPSRMNVGQVLETHLGYAAKILGMKIATPVFDGINEALIRDMLDESKQVSLEDRKGHGWSINKGGEVIDEMGRKREDYYVNNDGKTTLFDGRTGERFNQRIVVGQIYMLKLDHLVVSKIHSRSVGPYSLVTQQPLGGKAQHGGQRFGEMEVWALQAYGAAYTLQEMLTVKSDDVTGRTKIYESIVRGDNSLQADVPESFNVLMNEMKALCLDIRPIKGGTSIALGDKR
jgi:DNA-directed RNA polymerase subunit beta